MKLAEDLRRSVLQAAVEGKLTGGSRDGWRFVELGEIITKDIGGGTPDKSNPEYWNGNIPWMSVKDFAGARNGFIEDTIDHISEQGLENSATNLIMPGAIIICMRMGLGKYARLKKPTAINQDLRAIWLSDDVLADYFLYFYSTLKIEGTGTTVKGIKRNELLSYPIPLPPIDEQRRIVSRLDAILPLIAELESAENELAELERRFPGDMRDSLLQAAIEGRLTASNTDNWRYVRLGEIVAKRIKRGKSPKYAPHSNTLVFAQKCNTKRGNIDLSLALYLDESTIGKYPEEEFMIDGDIVLNSTGRGTLGRVGQYRMTDNPQNIPLVPDSHVTIIRSKQNISSEYICYVLKNYQAYIETLGEGSTNQTELSAKKIAGLIIPLPPIDEQHKIVTRLNELLPLCEALEKIT